MADAYHHSLSSVKKWGGEISDYYEIHSWFDESKHHHGDFRHRILRHHTLGIAECIKKFGKIIILSSERKIPTRWVAEQHVIEDIGYIPSFSDWVTKIQPEKWMNQPRKLSRELD